MKNRAGLEWECVITSGCALFVLALLATPVTSVAQTSTQSPPQPVGSVPKTIGAPSSPSLATPVPTSTPATDGFLVCLMQTSVDRKTTPSSTCLACHDGSKQQVMPDGGSYPVADARQGHRFDVDYSTVYGKADYRRDPTGYNTDVILLGGTTVSCLTCHDSKSTQLNHLAAPTSGPLEKRLCAACHIQ